MTNPGRIRAVVSLRSATAKTQVSGVSAKSLVGTDVHLGAAKVLMTGLTSRFSKPEQPSKR